VRRRTWIAALLAIAGPFAYLLVAPAIAERTFQKEVIEDVLAHRFTKDGKTIGEEIGAGQSVESDARCDLEPDRSRPYTTRRALIMHCSASRVRIDRYELRVGAFGVVEPENAAAKDLFSKMTGLPYASSPLDRGIAWRSFVSEVEKSGLSVSSTVSALGTPAPVGEIRAGEVRMKAELILAEAGREALSKLMTELAFGERETFAIEKVRLLRSLPLEGPSYRWIALRFEHPSLEDFDRDFARIFSRALAAHFPELDWKKEEAAIADAVHALAKRCTGSISCRARHEIAPYSFWPPVAIELREGQVAIELRTPR
jgi:hypothetical protein